MHMTINYIQRTLWLHQEAKYEDSTNIRHQINKIHDNNSTTMVEYQSHVKYDLHIEGEVKIIK